MNPHRFHLWLAASITLIITVQAANAQPASAWQLGAPIVTYWAGPAMTDAAATQMREGGWNLVWCTEKELDVVQRHGLRAQLTDPLIAPATLADPVQKQKLDDLIARVSRHPALYDYFITDEPNTTNFAGLGQLVAYLREHDPRHLAYINLFPTYASNEQLGNPGDKVTAYQAHLREFIDTVKPALLSYDHYQFSVRGDNPDYFLNLGLIRTAAQQAGLPFLNIVQAATWTASMRVPGPDEMRYLVYTTLAYGAQGISYYVYSCAGHTGAIAHADGTPTELYPALKALNREFAAVAGQVQPLRSLAVYHVGMQPPGAVPLPKDSVWTLDPPVAEMPYRPPERVRGILLGCFGRSGKAGGTEPASHVVVVNLDYKNEAAFTLGGPGRLEVFDPGNGRWSRARGRTTELRLLPGGGRLVRVR